MRHSHGALRGSFRCEADLHGRAVVPGQAHVFSRNRVAHGNLSHREALEGARSLVQLKALTEEVEERSSQRDQTSGALPSTTQVHRLMRKSAGLPQLAKADPRVDHRPKICST